METRWRIEMLGELRVVGDDRVITRFRTHRTGALLAYLAYYQHRNHPRELLIELCWPEEAPESGWMKLRTALSSLRRQLEPPGTPRGSVILADRRSVRLNGAVVTTDVTQFEAALDSAGSAESGCAAEPEITAAIELYRGPLLPGYYEPWVLPEQQRLANRFHSAAQCLVRDLEQSGQMDRAVEVAGRAVAADPLHEEAHAELIRLSMRTGQRAAALRQYRELERLLREALDEAPSPETRQLLECARDHGGPGPKQEEPHLSSAMATHGSTAPAASPTRRSGPEPQPAALRGSAAARPGYLPVPVNRFFGREAEIVQVRELLLVDRARLVTLTGPGGSGKTRLSLEVATQVREAVDGAVWFVPLVDLADPRRIADTIRDAMRLPRIPNQPALERVVHALRDRRALLVLDNLEHLLDEGAAVIQALLEEAPLLHCLVTSRFVVDIAAEREVVVQPLPTPVSSEHEAQPGAAVGGPTREGGSSLPTAHWSLPTLLQCPSVALFVDRVQAVRPDFQVTAGNAAAVAEICRRLEGIPLAIELAAAQSRLLSPRQMVRQLEQRFDLLVSRRRDLHPRHQTLRATLQWSYGLLSPELQRFFRGLSVFRGGWTLEAAQFVADVPHALAPLGQLREASLVLCEEEAGEVRYRLLETVREFGWSELEKRGEAGETRRRHAEFFLRLAEEARIELRGSDQIAWYRRVEREHDNVRAVLAWSVETGEAESGLRLAGLLEWFWRTQGHLKEGREYIEPLLCLPAAQPRTRARVMALHTAGLIALDLGITLRRSGSAKRASASRGRSANRRRS